MSTKQKIRQFENQSAVNLYGYNLILKNILSVLINLGLTNTQAKILVYLGKTGNNTAFNVANALGLSKLEVYQHIQSLQKMNLVSVINLCGPSKFKALDMNGVPIWPICEEFMKNDSFESENLMAPLR